VVRVRAGVRAVQGGEPQRVGVHEHLDREGRERDVHVRPGAEGLPGGCLVGVRARYCNWLQNGKAGQAQAFEKGVYDASTFTFNANGSANHNYTHAPDAKYWIPTFDEWIKGTYYDPAKSGSGQDGYWAYPNSSDSPPTPGLPGTPGATTNAGIPLSEDALSVGSYPDAKSPWGLLDTSGGLREWTSSDDQTVARRVMVQGSTAGDSLYTFTDYLGSAGLFASAPKTSRYGIRLASAVPSPSSLGVFVVWIIITRKGRCK